MTDIFKDKTEKVTLAEARAVAVMARMEPSDAPGTHVPGLYESQKTDKAVRSVSRPRYGHGY